MVIIALIVVGLCLGSFVNALVWRVHAQSVEQGKARPSKKRLQALSISTGRSMCLSCQQPLAAKDLIPIVSWLWLRGTCRYCHKAIPDTPVAELAVPLLFVLSYLYWPNAISGLQVGIFAAWLVLLVGFVALTIYDLRWFLLPDRIVLPLAAVAVVMAALTVADSNNPDKAMVAIISAVAVGGGIFWLLFQVSNGRWIGGGDVKLGWLLGLVVATPAKAAMLIFIAALAGTVLSVPLIATGKMSRTSTIPFGPFLIAGAVVAMLFGADILDWYQQLFIIGG